jgi:acetylornithine deacetylase/succinyl-diaminopimelate desuccinylase-like protein
MAAEQSATHESSTSRNELERLWNAVKHVAGWQWDYEAVPFDEVMSRPRYSHLKCALAAAAAQLFIQSETREISAGGARDLRLHGTHGVTGSIFGLTVHVDPDVPDGTIIIRDELGRELGRIINVGR